MRLPALLELRLRPDPGKSTSVKLQTTALDGYKFRINWVAVAACLMFV